MKKIPILALIEQVKYLIRSDIWMKHLLGLQRSFSINYNSLAEDGII